jgi:uncharacterized membrane protein
MRILPIIALSLVILLSSCGKSGTPTPGAQEPSPYPSVPMNQVQSGANSEKALLPPPEAKTTDSFSVKWTEPFWAVEIEKNTAVLSRPGTNNTITTNFTVSQEDKWAILSIKWVKWDFFLTLVKSTCSDGMSDMAYTYSATLNVGAEVLRGCANRK